MKTKTEKEFFEKYTPMKNPIDNNAAFNGTMYETFGEEMDFINIQNDKMIWTIIDEEDTMYILAGRHLVNRIGYIITKEEWENDEEIYKFE